MLYGKTLRCLIAFFILCALAAVHAARQGLQPAAALMPTHPRRSWRQTCADFDGTASDEQLRRWGVKRWQGRCYCHYSYPYPSNKCGDVVAEVKGGRYGRTYRAFDLRAAHQGCSCLKGFDKAMERSEVVAAAAVRFCAAVVEKTSKTVGHLHKMSEQQTFVQKMLKSPQLCQEILTGTLDDFGTSQSKDVFREANGLSHHTGTKGWGHLDPLITGGLPSSTDYQKLLHHVCHDECEDIVNQTIKNIVEMTRDVGEYAKPSEQSCADRVVRQVEAEILGCCGRSCGWDGRSCGSWPFLNKTEKVDWLQQCCSEYNVLQNSSRERMCDSVLSPKQVRLVSKFDTKAKKGDVGAAYIGQDPKLLWAKPGLDKFRKQLKKLKQEPKENEPVSSDFFEKNPDVRKKGIEKGWFHEEKDPEQSTSLAQLVEATTCDGSKLQIMKDKEHCTDETWQSVKKTCFQSKNWQISDKPNPDMDDECQVKMTDPTINRPQEVATPEECQKMDFGFGPGVKRRFFIYDNSDPPEGELILDNPILCFHEKEPCPDDDDFVRKNLNEVDRTHFEGFTKYIYWTEGT